MKKTISLLIALVAVFAVFSSCDDDVTYAEMRKAENKSIENFIKKGCLVKAEDGKTVVLQVNPIKVISEADFAMRNYTTNLSANEYVLLSGSGVYMQIVRQGCGEKIEDGENCRVVCRFQEFNISADSLQLSNRLSNYEQMADVMSVSKSLGNYTAYFRPGGLMYTFYGSTVPSGWLRPLDYLRIGRQYDDESEIAKVRIIVPSGEGHSRASQNIYACFYDITMQRGR